MIGSQIKREGFAVFEVRMDFSDLEKIRSQLMTVIPKLVAEVSKQTLFFVSDIQRRQMSGRRGGVYLNVDTGNLRRSWFAQTRIDGSGINTRAFTNVPYAAIHQYGGVIRRSERQAILSFRKGRPGFQKPSSKAFLTKAKGQYQQKVTVSEGVTRIPKRLFIEEEFDRQMPARYEKAVLKTILGAFKSG